MDAMWLKIKIDHDHPIFLKIYVQAFWLNKTNPLWWSEIFPALHQILKDIGRERYHNRVRSIACFVTSPLKSSQRGEFTGETSPATKTLLPGLLDQLGKRRKTNPVSGCFGH